MNEQEFRRRQRLTRVVNDWLAGASMDTIAARHAMTREAVRHIVDTTPRSTPRTRPAHHRG